MHGYIVCMCMYAGSSQTGKIKENFIAWRIVEMLETLKSLRSESSTFLNCRIRIRIVWLKASKFTMGVVYSNLYVF